MQDWVAKLCDTYTREHLDELWAYYSHKLDGVILQHLPGVLFTCKLVALCTCTILCTVPVLYEVAMLFVVSPGVRRLWTRSGQWRPLLPPNSSYPTKVMLLLPALSHEEVLQELEKEEQLPHVL